MAVPEESRKERYLHTLFVWGVALKAINGALEIVGGIALFSPGLLTRFVEFLVTNELFEDPRNFLLSHMPIALPALTGSLGLFIALYLLIHGVVKIVLVVGLLRNKVWAYPTAIVVFLLFIAYQLYHYVLSPSLILIVLTVLDLGVIWLTWHEYRYFKKYHVFAE